ncbi:MAG: hypothetical protein H0X38_02535 [Planctomycetes bacterium]|nr:hypothetical protein [Planctomycetota bacterium]
MPILHLLIVTIACTAWAAAGEPAPVVDLSGFAADSGVTVGQVGGTLMLDWPIAAGRQGRLVLRVGGGEPLIASLGLGEGAAIISEADPFYVLTVGKRILDKQTGWTVFFDSPYTRPYQHSAATLARSAYTVTSLGRSVSVTIAGLSAGVFAGDLRFTVWAGCPLVRQEAVVATTEGDVALSYGAGLTARTPSWDGVAWRDNHDTWQHASEHGTGASQPVATRLRTVIAESAHGSLAAFPAPHQFFYPLDFADNFAFNLVGRGYGKVFDTPAFGIRQSIDGDRRHVPWVNAPPGSQQHLGVFYLLSPGDAQHTYAEVATYTHGDAYVPLPGYHTFTSHYHIEHTLDLMRAQRDQQTTGIPKGFEQPAFIDVFRHLGIDIAHLAEFHVGETPNLADGPRLAQLAVLHGECRRLSGDGFLLLPGEEPNVHLGGHWISFFPKPVNWVLNRPAGTPFSAQVADVGTVYHVGSPADVQALFEQEHGLFWTAHPRIKASGGQPDSYQATPFFHSPNFLGGTWKAMPADLSLPRLGTRSLDLLDDMANWGERKQVLGEADLFKIMLDYEVYAHLNINYLQLPKVPTFDQPWTPILETLRAGRFFTTTGEMLITAFEIGGKGSGEELALPASGATIVRAHLAWTFPPAFAEVVWGDGVAVHRQRVDLSRQPAFAATDLAIPVVMPGATWARFAAWDVAVDGAFTQPVWMVR